MTHYIENRLNIPRTGSRQPWWFAALVILLLICVAHKAKADNFVSFHESSEAQTSVDCLAEALFYEARGEGKIGMFLAGEVIRERVEDRTYEFKALNTYCEVVHQPSRDPSRPWLCAFSYYCDGLPEVYNASIPGEVASMTMAYEMAERIYHEPSHARLNLTDNALYYTQHEVSQGWMERTQITLVYEGHTFRKPLEQKMDSEVEWPRVYSDSHYSDFVDMNERSQGSYFEQVEADYIKRELMNTVGLTGYDQMLKRYKKERYNDRAIY